MLKRCTQIKESVDVSNVWNLFKIVYHTYMSKIKNSVVTLLKLYGHRQTTRTNITSSSMIYIFKPVLILGFYLSAIVLKNCLENYPLFANRLYLSFK